MMPLLLKMYDGPGVPPAPSARPAGPERTHSSLTLIERAQHGDERARDELYERYLPRLRRWTHGRLPGWARDHLDTEDIVQDTLLQTIRRLDSFLPNHDRSFCAYLCQAVRNRLTDAVRRSARRPVTESLSPNAAATDPSPFEFAVGRQTAEQYSEALSRLSDSDRELIVARVELGLGYPEITALTGKASQSASRVAVSRALLRLAVEMRHDREP
jgi:RNA polymerase sigma-70 factor, ECF subfamily